MGVDDVRDDAVVHVARLTGNDLGDGDAFVLGLVGEHRPGDHVADRVDAGDIGLEMSVDGDAAALVERDARLLQPEPLGVGTAADRDQDDVGLDHLGGAAGGRLDRDLERVAAGIDAGDLARQAEGHPLPLQDALGLAGDLAVGAREDAIEELDHGDLAAEPAPDRAELEADDAGADHQQPPRHRGKDERPGRGDDRAARRWRRRGAAPNPSRWR